MSFSHLWQLWTPILLNIVKFETNNPKPLLLEWGPLTEPCFSVTCAQDNHRCIISHACAWIDVCASRNDARPTSYARLPNTTLLHAPMALVCVVVWV